jgi:hypothetical protein
MVVYPSVVGKRRQVEESISGHSRKKPPLLSRPAPHRGSHCFKASKAVTALQWPLP